MDCRDNAARTSVRTAESGDILEMMKVKAVGVLFWLVLCVELVCGIRFYLEPGEKRCFTEELPASSEVSYLKNRLRREGDFGSKELMQAFS